MKVEWQASCLERMNNHGMVAILPMRCVKSAESMVFMISRVKTWYRPYITDSLHSTSRTGKLWNCCK